MALIKSKSTLEVIRYIPPRKTKPKLPVILKRSKRKVRVCNVLAGLCMGLYLGVLLRPKFLSLAALHFSTPRPAADPVSDAEAILPRGEETQGQTDGWSSSAGEKGRGISDVGLSESGLLFVGVMTANSYLNTRATSVYDTWARDIPGRVAFFTSESSTLPAARPDLPLVKLRGVDDSYPPQKKSFLMLQYMWERYGDKYEWFMRADDDLYVRGERLARMLRSVDSSKPQFIGQAGRGNQEEFGLLSLEYDENFCMGGPGVIMSRATLALVAPHIKYCLKNLYTTHEDVELGSEPSVMGCLPHKNNTVIYLADHHYTSNLLISRSTTFWFFIMQHILYHNSSGRDAFTGNLKVKEVHRAMTLHPVKRHKYMYRIHNYMRGLKIHDLQQDMLNKHRDIYAMLRLLGGNLTSMEKVELSHNSPLFANGVGEEDYLGDPYLLGKEPGLLKPPLELIPWNFVSRSIYSPGNLNPRKKLESHIKEGLDDVIREVMENLNTFSRERGRMIEFQELLYGYYRENPLHGADYILDLLLVYKKYRGRKMTVPVRKHAYVQQQFTGLEIREMVEDLASTELRPPSTSAEETAAVNSDDVIYDTMARNQGRRSKRQKKTVINFIMGLSGRVDTFHRFIDNFERVCLQADGQVKLYIVLFPNTNGNTGNTNGNTVDTNGNSVNRTMTLVNALNEKYPRRISASQVRYPHDLLFFIDVDILFTAHALERIRRNTLRARQVYFPVVYSQYDPALVYSSNAAPDHYRISEEGGYWRTFGFGIAACYKTDFDKVGGFDSSISGWGKEDVDLFDKFVRGGPAPSGVENPLRGTGAPSSPGPRIFRAPDPDLVHVYHAATCDKQSLGGSQYTMCVNSRADTLASRQVLAGFVARNREHFVRRTKLIPANF
ncbi:hypothetical protein M8J76_016297 [Diaphorina citri]|nr:hypothetical protein M8J76_016297 [Diaphorina citri]